MFKNRKKSLISVLGFIVVVAVSIVGITAINQKINKSPEKTDLVSISNQPVDEDIYMSSSTRDIEEAISKMIANGQEVPPGLKEKFELSKQHDIEAYYDRIREEKEREKQREEAEKNFDENIHKSPATKEVEERISKMIANGQEVPSEMKDKLECCKEQDKHMYIDMIIRGEKIPKDENGNPILRHEPLKQGVEPRPDSELIIEKMPEAHRYIATFGRICIDTADIKTLAYGRFNILVSGFKRDDNTIGIIYNKISGSESFGSMKEHYEYPGKGAIIFESYADNYNIIIFTYGDNQKGYFDLRTNEAVFEKYDSK